jgi:feruloyl esterase
MKAIIAIAIAIFVLASLPAAAATCDSLASLAIPHTTIDSVETVAAGAFAPPAAPAGFGGGGAPPDYSDLPAFCRVTATSIPTSDSDIKIEVWLPMADAWNGNFAAYGNGGWTGSIRHTSLAGGVRRGYATGVTDTGHQGGSASFAMGHPEKLVDFGHRSIHELAVTGKALTRAFYENEPAYAYWAGCSAGGRQGLKAAQVYPEDFDGIVAGAPGLMWTGRATQAIWIAQATHASDDSALPQEKLSLIHDAVLAECDALDGVEDGVLEHPRQCDFDPAVLACPAGRDGSACLTQGQVATVERIYSDVRNPRTGEIYFPGHERGSELGWRTMAGARPFGPGVDLFRYVVFEDENWDFMTLNFDADIERALEADAAADALDPNLKPFYDRGGRIVQYHGWNDPQISPRVSSMYYERVIDILGEDIVRGHHRLFMVPGMAHCGGGEGTSSFDILSVLERWVESGSAPDSVEASRVVDGRVDRTRPLCAYPAVARYVGSGSIDEASSFSCEIQGQLP